MKKILNLNKNFKLKNFIHLSHKPISILNQCREKFLHREPILSNINPNRFETFDHPKKRHYKLVKSKNLDPLLKKYLLEEPKEKELKLEEKTPTDETNIENQFMYPVLLTKKIESLINSPHIKFDEFEKLNKNPNSYFENLINSSIVKDLNTLIDNPKNFDLYKNNLLALMVYIKFLFYNFPVLLSDSQILGIITKCVKIVVANLKSSKTEEKYFYSIDFFYEILQIRDRLLNSNKNIDKIFLKSLDKSVLDINETWDISTSQHFMKLVSDLDNSADEKITTDKNSKMFYLFKIMFIEAKITKNTNFLNKLYNSQDKKKFSDFITNLDIDTYDSFKFNIEKKIIFYLSLKNLKLFHNKEMIRNLKFTNFDFDSFHILYKGLLKKQGIKEEINLEFLRKELLNGLNNKNFFNCENIKKFKLMSETIDYFIFSNMNNFTILNKVNYIQQNEKQFLFSYLKKILQFVPNASETDDIIFLAYYMCNNIYNPEIFNLLVDKPFDIEEANPENLRKFIDAVNNRLNYLLRYEHEIYMLKKAHREYFPYSDSLDKFIVSITRQFMYKTLDKSKDISKEIFECGLKCLKILIEMDVNNPNYALDEFVKQSIKPMINSCLSPESKYFKHMVSSSEIVNDFLEISPFLKYYYDKQTQGYNDDKNNSGSDINLSPTERLTQNSSHIENIFENFILNLVKKNSLKDQNDLRMLSNVAEYVILELMANPSRSETEIFNKIISGLVSHFKKLFIIQGKERSLSLNTVFADYPENQLPALLLNVYNILMLNKEQYKDFISYLQDFIVKIQGLKNLKGYDLLKLRKELINEKTLYQFVSNFQSIQTPKNKENLLTELTQKSILKNFVMDIYNSIDSSVENNSGAIEFSSLTYLTSLVFESLTTDEILKILKFLGNKKFENYHPNFVKNLLNKFSNRDLLFSLFKNSEEQFFSLATSWPLFVKNPELVRVLLHSHKSKLLQISRYQIINVFSFNNVNHSSLLSFFGKSITKIKNFHLKKKITCDYIYNCAFIGYKIDTETYNFILSLYEQIHSDIEFTFNELVEIIALGIISNITDSSLTDQNKKIYYDIIELINRNVTSKLLLKHKDREIVYYPSIPSEDRFFQKSMMNIYSITDSYSVNNNNVKEEDDEEDDDEEVKEDNLGNRSSLDTPVYARDSKEGQKAIDSKFENFFLKKKESVFGHQININDTISTSLIIKKWCIAKLFGMVLQDEYLENQLTHILNKHQHANKNSQTAEKFYLKLLSYGFQHNLVIESMYKEKITGLKVDYFITYKDIQSIILYIPEAFTSHDTQDDKKKPDGIYSLMIECLRRLTNYNIIPVMETQLAEFSEMDYEEKIMKIILNTRY